MCLIFNDIQSDIHAELNLNQSWPTHWDWTSAAQVISQSEMDSTHLDYRMPGLAGAGRSWNVEQEFD